MAFDSSNFNSRSSLRARAKGQQYWVYDAGSDLLATAMAANYFLSEYQGLQVDDIIQASTLGGAYDLKVVTSTVDGVTVERAGSLQALSGAGAVDTISRRTDVTSGGADALTLIDGAIGQRKTIVHVVDGGAATLTPTTGLGYSTIVFTTAGEAVELEFGTGGWAVIGFGGPSATLPAIA
jgi:hypothetical protein